MGIRVVRIGKYGNLGEDLAKNQLHNALQKTGHQHAVILVNPRIPIRDDLQRETDLILIYKYGVVVIEVKNFIGPVVLDRQYGCYNGSKQINDPRGQAIDCKNALMEFLGKSNVTPAMNCMVWFMSDKVHIEQKGNFSAPVRTLTSGSTFLASGDIARRQYSRNLSMQNQLRPEQMVKIEKLLCGVTTKDYIKTIRNYQLLHEIGGPLHVEFSASHIDSQDDLSIPRIRLKRHCLMPIDTEEKLEQFKEFRAESLRTARRLYEVLDKLDKVPGIPSVRDCFTDPSDDTVIWTAYKFIDGMSMYDYCKSKNDREIFRLCGSLAGTLQACHEHRIYHRTVTPKSIVVPNEGRLPVPVLLGFDFARIDNKDSSQRVLTIRNQIYEAAYRSNYAAPEVRTDVSAADARSDIYSLGVVLLETLARRQLSTINSANAAAAIADLRRRGTTTDVIDLLASMIDSEPNRRPPSMDVVQTVFGRHA